MLRIATANYPHCCINHNDDHYFDGKVVIDVVLIAVFARPLLMQLLWLAELCHSCAVQKVTI